mmetsp:Transcript_35470/g.113295  ORF Transcript_35470/g.113295 Transcript_35470/m.113295 type:complete len:207 (+) Transcript_35470:749-1369(+)
MNHKGALAISYKAPIRDPPASFFSVNGGMIVTAKKAAVHSFLADWLSRIEKRLFDGDTRVEEYETLDQPPLREALYDALARRTLTFYPLPPMWNFRSWNEHLGVEINHIATSSSWWSPVRVVNISSDAFLSSPRATSFLIVVGSFPLLFPPQASDKNFLSFFCPSRTNAVRKRPAILRCFHNYVITPFFWEGPLRRLARRKTSAAG